MDGGVIELPADHGAIHYEAELVIRIGGAFVPGAGVSELIDAFALGLDLTLRDLQHELKSKQHPWLAAKGFRHAAPITKFHQLTGDPMRELSACSYSLRINGEERQRGQIDEMIFRIGSIDPAYRQLLRPGTGGCDLHRHAGRCRPDRGRRPDGAVLGRGAHRFCEDRIASS